MGNYSISFARATLASAAIPVNPASAAVVNVFHLIGFFQYKFALHYMRH